MALCECYIEPFSLLSYSVLPRSTDDSRMGARWSQRTVGWTARRYARRWPSGDIGVADREIADSNLSWLTHKPFLCSPKCQLGADEQTSIKVQSWRLRSPANAASTRISLALDPRRTESLSLLQPHRLPPQKSHLTPLRLSMLIQAYQCVSGPRDEGTDDSTRRHQGTTMPPCCWAIRDPGPSVATSGTESAKREINGCCDSFMTDRLFLPVLTHSRYPHNPRH